LVASHRWLTDYRLNEPDVIGRSHYEVFPEIPERWKEIHRRCLGGAVEKSDADEFLREDGSRDWLRWEVRPWHTAQGDIGGLIIFSEVITERKLGEDELRTSREQLRALSARLQTAREAEGTRIAREIHDELGGALTGLKWDLEGIDKILLGAADGVGAATVREKIPHMTGLIESTINAVRRISSELRPGVLDDLGLVAAIEWQAQQFQARTGIQCECVAGTDSLDLDRERSTAVFRILQEILTNVIRHAQATTVDIGVQQRDGYVELRVSDNGRGITETEMGNTRSLGLLGMRERALLVGGEVGFSSAPGQGTTVTARVPVQLTPGT